MALPLAPLIYFGLRKGATVLAKRGAKYLAKRAAKKAAKKGKKEKPKKKYTMPRKKLMEHGEREAKREKTKELRDSTQEEINASRKSIYERPYPKVGRERKAAVERHKKAKRVLERRDAMDEADARIRRTRGGGHHRTEHSITGKVKGDTDLRDFGRSLLKQDIRVAKHVKGLQELKKMREMVKSGDLPKHVSKRLAREYGKHTRERVIYPKLAKPAKESFQRIQKKKDRFKKKDAKKKGKQGD